MLLGGLFPHPTKPHDVLIVHNPTYMRKLGRIISLFGKRYVLYIIWIFPPLLFLKVRSPFLINYTYKYLYTSYFVNIHTSTFLQVLKISIDLWVTLITPLKVHCSQNKSVRTTIFPVPVIYFISRKKARCAWYPAQCLVTKFEIDLFVIIFCCNYLHSFTAKKNELKTFKSNVFLRKYILLQ